MENIDKNLFQTAINEIPKRLVFTSYFAMSSKLPDYIVPIAICGGIPEFWEGSPWIKELAPKKKMVFL